jgi:hypothetical protein
MSGASIYECTDVPTPIAGDSSRSSCTQDLYSKETATINSDETHISNNENGEDQILDNVKFYFSIFVDT